MVRPPVAEAVQAAWRSERSRTREVGDLVDAVIVGGAVVVSFVLYVGRLGFYSDDWAFLGSLRVAGDHSLVGHLGSIDWAQYLRPRPMQVAYQQLLFDAFGLRPLGYHLVNGALLTTMAILLYLVLRELDLWRPLAVALPIVYALLPHYSVDRYWFAAFGYVFSMTMFFLSTYADLRAARSRVPWSWKILAIVALLASVTGYEIALPLFVLTLIPLAHRYRARAAAETDGPVGRGWAWFVAPNVVAVGGVIAFKVLATAGMPETPTDLPLHAARVSIGAVAINFGSLGVGLPQAVLWAAREATPLALATGVVLAGAVAGYVRWIIDRSAGFPTAHSWGHIVAAGAVIFAVSYTVFLPTERILFTSTGLNNRVGIAGALGVAIVFLGALGWVSRTFLARPAWRATAFAAGVAGLVLTGFLLVNVQGEQWGTAWSRQRTILGQLEARLPFPAPRSVVILHGVCPYVGGTTVFESSWDVTGALRATYGDPSLLGDVTSANLEIEGQTLSTTLYGSLEEQYRLGPRTVLFDPRRGVLSPLPDAETARALVTAPSSDTACPRGRAGYGVPILPFDEVYRRFENRHLWPEDG